MSDFLIILAIIVLAILLGRYFALLRVSKQFRDFDKEQERELKNAEKKIHPEMLLEKQSAKAEMEELNQYRHEAREHNLQKTMGLAKEKEFITNDDIEHALGVSNATAERYLDELERRGVLEQLGEKGRGVKYRKNK